jgi:MYXO-CTERM domain-containing protein
MTFGFPGEPLNGRLWLRNAIALVDYGSVGSDTSYASVQGQRYLPEPSPAQSLGAMLAVLVALARRRQRIELTHDRAVA